MKRIYNTYFFVILLLVGAGCAQLGVPSGGDVDKEAPVILKSSPENETVNFSESVIEVTFDEYIQLNDIYNQIIISPPLREKPEISIKKKTVKIEFNEELLENTTYSVNFGEGIKDYNAGNVLRNYIMAFSTGNALDSLSISGKVTDAFSSVAKENVKVMLYTSFEDSLPRTTKPFYFAQTDKDGNYQIKYLPEGDYKVFALEELDGNFLYDELDENIGFLDSLISLNPLDSIAPVVNISMFNEELEMGYVSSVKTDSTGLFKIAFSSPQKELVAYQKDLGDSVAVKRRFNKQRDTLFCFTKSTTPIFLERTDSRFPASEILLDTLELKAYDSLEVSVANKHTVINKEFKTRVGPSQLLSFNSTRPISGVDTSKIKFESADSISISDYEIEIMDDFRFQLKTNLGGAESYKLSLFPGAITSSFQLIEMDSTFVRWKVLEEKELGEIIVEFNLDVQNPIIELSDLSLIHI